jgi:two-component system NarL family sensor kinase
MLIEESKLALIIILSMLFSLGMALGIVMLSNKNRRILELSEDLLQETLKKKELERIGVVLKTQENERTEIARKLHDEVGGLLSIVQKQISLVKRKGEKGEFDKLSLTDASVYLQESIDQMRSITKDLMPHYLLKFGLSNALERMAQQKTTNLIEHFHFESALNDDLQLPEPVMTHNFFIASELLTNLLKHSNAKQIHMKLSWSISNELILQLRHDGKGLTHLEYENLVNSSDTFGLENIRYRLTIIGAAIQYDIHDNFAQTTIVSPLDLDIKLEKANEI